MQIWIETQTLDVVGGRERGECKANAGKHDGGREGPGRKKASRESPCCCYVAEAKSCRSRDAGTLGTTSGNGGIFLRSRADDDGTLTALTLDQKSTGYTPGDITRLLNTTLYMGRQHTVQLNFQSVESSLPVLVVMTVKRYLRTSVEGRVDGL